MTKIFLDTEFTGLHQGTSLVSMALVAESGEEFYAEFTDYDQSQFFPWLEENVTPKLITQNSENKKFLAPETIYISGNQEEVKNKLESWLSQFKTIEIWADVLAYDWVLFCELFGGALHVPYHIYYAPFDFATLLRLRGDIQPKGKYEGDFDRFGYAGIDKSWQHNALVDARVEKICYQKIMGDE